MHNFGIFSQFANKLAITLTFAIDFMEKYDVVIEDCHHSLCVCGD